MLAREEKRGGGGLVDGQTTTSKSKPLLSGEPNEKVCAPIEFCDHGFGDVVHTHILTQVRESRNVSGFYRLDPPPS